MSIEARKNNGFVYSTVYAQSVKSYKGFATLLTWRSKTCRPIAPTKKRRAGNPIGRLLQGNHVHAALFTQFL